MAQRLRHPTLAGDPRPADSLWTLTCPGLAGTAPPTAQRIDRRLEKECAQGPSCGEFSANDRTLRGSPHETSARDEQGNCTGAQEHHCDRDRCRDLRTCTWQV